MSYIPLNLFRSLALISLLSVSLFSTANAQAGPERTERQRVIVRLNEPSSGSAISQETLRRTILQRHVERTSAVIGEADAFSVTHLYSDPNYFAADVDMASLQALRADPNIASVEPDHFMRPTMLEIGDAIEAPILHAEGIDGTGVTIVQFDTGVDTDHPFIAANLEHGLCFSTTRENGMSLCPGGLATAVGPAAAEACTDLPECAHGTQTAGIMVGSNADMRGVAPGARLLPVQVFTRMTGEEYCGERDACLVAWYSDLFAAELEISHWAYGRHEDVGAIYYGFADLPYIDVENSATNLNSACVSTFGRSNSISELPRVIPSGNEGRYQRFRGMPCGVGFGRMFIQSETATGEISDFSNTWVIHSSANWNEGTAEHVFGSIPDLSAAGEGVPTSTLGGEYGAVTGTSAAAAQVAGATALLRSVGQYSPTEIWGAFRASGPFLLDRRLNHEVTSVRVGQALDILDQTTLGPFRINEFSQLDFIREVGTGFDSEIVFGGTVGGPFSLYQSYINSPYEAEISISTPGGFHNPNEFIGIPLSASASASWIEIEAPSSTQRTTSIIIRLNEVAATLPAGVHRSSVSIEIDGYRPLRRTVLLLVGSPNTNFPDALQLSGLRDFGFGYFGSAEAVANASVLGLVPNLRTLWWKWVAPESGDYIFRAREPAEQPFYSFRASVFRGENIEALEAIQTELRCAVRNTESGVVTESGAAGANPYYRFLAEAGEVFHFAVQQNRDPNFDAVGVQLMPALSTGYETRDTPLEISGSSLSMPIALHGLTQRCVQAPLSLPGYFAGGGDAWLLWTPSHSGRHAYRLRHGNTIDGTQEYPRDGLVEIFDASGDTLLSSFTSNAGSRVENLYDGLIEAQSSQRYLIHVSGRGTFGAILEIISPEDNRSPLNDNFADATDVVGPLSSFRGTNRYATRQPGFPDLRGGGHSQWWRFVPESDGRAYITTEGSIVYDGISAWPLINFEVFEGASYEQLDLIQLGSRISSFEGASINHFQSYFDVDAGQTYYVKLDSMPGAPAPDSPHPPYRLTIGWGQNPLNDDFADAISIAFGETIHGQNRFASGETDEPTEDIFYDLMREREELGVWYRWTAPETGRYRINATSAFINPQIAVYTGSEVDALSLVRGVAHNGGPPPALTPFVFDFDAVAGTTYSIRVSSYMRQQGDFTFWLSPGAPSNDSLNSPTQIQPIYPVGSEQTRFISVVDNTYATADPGEGNHAGFSPEASIWYGSSLSEYELAPYSINTSGSTVDTQITLYSPYYSEGSEPLASNDNVADGLTSAEIFAPNRESTPRRNSPGIMFVITSPPGQRGIIRVNAGWDNTLYPRLRGATLPYARSGVVGQPITGFATLLNNGYRAGLDCGLALADPSQPFDLEFRPTNPATNAIDGAVGETRGAEVLRPVTYLFALTPREPVAAREVALTYSCANADDAPSVAGVNTVLISADTTQQPDILSIGTTASNDGVIRIPSTSGVGFLSTAALNLGSTGEITFSADVTGTDIPVTIEVCETDLSNGGACRTPRAALTTVSFGAGEVKTFAVFVRANGAVAFDPAGVRIFARWRDGGGVVRGATSAAVRTP
ncbi:MULTISPECIES: S8 family serine peptidase [Hyphobacterium]|uniref:S8 family serine peptidase n=1 Tax=Hyphobacterium vulgare TaxID=1736751 RepID=A0ABV7A1D9_9PROT